MAIPAWLSCCQTGCALLCWAVVADCLACTALRCNTQDQPQVCAASFALTSVHPVVTDMAPSNTHAKYIES